MTVYLVHLFQTSKVFHKIFCIVTKLVEHILLSEQGRGRTFSTHGRKSTNMLSSAGKTHDPTNIMPQSLQTKKLTIYPRSNIITRINCTANILNLFITAFDSVTFPIVIWLYMLQPKTAIDLKLYSSMSLSVMVTAVSCDNHCQITVESVTQPMTRN